MEKKQVLIPGGYGAVGTIISTLLSKNNYIMPVVAGRNEDQAKQLAQDLNCKWTTIDLENSESIEHALNNIDIVISCYIPSSDFNTFLPDICAESGIHYLDVAAFNQFNEKVMDLNKKAALNGAILITALGLFPGIPGLILGSNTDHFDKIDSADIFFTSGGNMDKLTPLALQGISHMMGVTPMQWENESWIKAPAKGRKEYISEPFNKKITFYPYMVTHDLVEIPKIIKTDKIVMWSMSESFFLGMVLLMGLKMGLAKTIKRAGKFLSVLKFLGKKKHRDYSLKIVSRGRKENLPYERVVEMNETEEFLTAIVPTIVCEQIANGDISRVGAYTGAGIVDTQKFIVSLKNGGINYKDITKKLFI